MKLYLIYFRINEMALRAPLIYISVQLSYFFFTDSPRHICWDSGPSLPFIVGKNWKKHDSFIARAIRTLFNATLGGENVHMIEQLNENLSWSVPTSYDVDCSSVDYILQSQHNTEMFIQHHVSFNNKSFKVG